MLRKNCDRCNRLLEAPDDMAGKRVSCPDCKDVNILPMRASDPDEPPATVSDGSLPDRATAAGLPPDSGPEQRVMVVRRAMIRARPMSGLGLILGLIGGLIGAGVMWNNPAAAMVSGGVSAVCLVILIIWKIRTFDSALVITNKRTTEREGLLSKNISEVLHDNIRNIQIHQTFMQRLWGVGEISISSAGQDGFEIRAKDIPRPEEVRKVIDLYRPL